MLRKEFVDQYRDKKVPWGGNGLGEFVYTRTYSRWLELEQRRETWQETIERVVNYSMSLYTGPASKEELQEESELLYDYMFNLKVFPAGRTLWVGGTESSKKSTMSQFNCAFTVIDSFKAFCDMFYLLMCGAGTGFRILERDVKQLPTLNANIVLANKPYNPKAKQDRREDTVAFEGDGTKLIVVGDSRQGWVDALSEYFSAMQRNDIESIIINYDSVRPYGEPLKTFGGRASGHSALRDMFRHIHTFTTKESKDGKLRPINCLDIANTIGYYVVAGGVRRTSEICLFDQADMEVLEAKKGLWTEGAANYGKYWRGMSNNSVFFERKPTREFLKKLQELNKVNAEPGIVNAVAAGKRRPNFEGINPCAEILLSNFGACNLSEIILPQFINDDGTINHAELGTALKLATRIGMRQTNVTMEIEDWDHVQKRDRLIGVSLDGYEDAKEKCTQMNLDEILELMRKIVHYEMVEYAHEMRIPIPLLATTEKPSGTLAQLPTVSSGVHKAFAPFYIRRVRISSSDALAQVMLELYPDIIYPENGEGCTVEEYNVMSQYERLKVLQSAKTWVIEFPVKTSASRSSAEEPALDQINRYFMFQEEWTDHNTSITIYVGEDEWDAVFDLLYERWDDYIGVSFLPKNDSTIYPLMPYEQISEDEYNRRVENMKTETSIHDLLRIRESISLATDLLDPSCETGVCPVR